MSVIKKGTVAINIFIGSFSEDRFPFLSIQVGMKICSFGVLYTMIRPEGLLFSMNLYNIKNVFSGMVRCKTYVILRMPVLRSNNQIKFGLYFIDNGNNLIAFRNRKCTIGHKIILSVNNY